MEAFPETFTGLGQSSFNLGVQRPRFYMLPFLALVYKMVHIVGWLMFPLKQRMPEPPREKSQPKKKAKNNEAVFTRLAVMTHPIIQKICSRRATSEQSATFWEVPPQNGAEVLFLIIRQLVR